MPRFVPERFHGDLVLFTAKADMSGVAPEPERWRDYVDGAIEVHPIDSRHREMAQPAPLARIGAVLAAKLPSSGGQPQ